MGAGGRVSCAAGTRRLRTHYAEAVSRAAQPSDNILGITIKMAVPDLIVNCRVDCIPRLGHINGYGQIKVPDYIAELVVRGAFGALTSRPFQRSTALLPPSSGSH